MKNIVVKGDNNIVGKGNRIIASGSSKTTKVSSAAKKLGIPSLPDIPITPQQRIWLQEIWSQLRSTGKMPEYRTLKLKTMDKVGRDFNAYKINRWLVFPDRPNVITMLGALLATEDPLILDDIDKLLYAIQKEVLSEDEKRDFLSAELATKTGLEVNYVRIVIMLLGGLLPCYNSASSPQEGYFGYDMFSVSQINHTNAFDFYVEFAGVRKALEKYYHKQNERESVEMVPTRQGIVMSGLGFAEPAGSVFPAEVFVDPDRIEQLKKLPKKNFNFSKLIALCEELNLVYASGGLFSVVMLVRAVIDHVPPVFGKTKFAQVAAEYGGSKSAKDSMKHLEDSSRKIADNFLHTQIRKFVAMPTRTQVNFSRDLDVMLGEIVAVVEADSKQ